MDFSIKPIARVMGTSITETSNEVKKAIEDIKNYHQPGKPTGNNNQNLLKTLKSRRK